MWSQDLLRAMIPEWIDVTPSGLLMCGKLVVGEVDYRGTIITVVTHGSLLTPGTFSVDMADPDSAAKLTKHFGPVLGQIVLKCRPT